MTSTPCIPQATRSRREHVTHALLLVCLSIIPPLDGDFGRRDLDRIRRFIGALWTASRPSLAGWVRVEAGTFRMGSPPTEPDRDGDEVRHQVRISRPFWLKAAEVTQGEWAVLMGTFPSHFRTCGSGCPVDSVSWFDALAFANALSRRTGLPECYEMLGCHGVPGAGCRPGEYTCTDGFQCDEVRFAGLDCAGYRLPTEAEWEYAARAGTETRFSSGDCSSADRARFDGGAPGLGCPRDAAPMTPVAGGSLPPNPWGLFEMHGNVYEWVWDWYGAYDGDEVEDPTGPEAGALRVVRGGSCTFPARHMRSADRSHMQPRWRADNDGFRLARTATAVRRRAAPPSG
jgi:sulfatase modifying factor 1